MKGQRTKEGEIACCCLSQFKTWKERTFQQWEERSGLGSSRSRTAQPAGSDSVTKDG